MFYGFPLPVSEIVPTQLLTNEIVVGITTTNTQGSIDVNLSYFFVKQLCAPSTSLLMVTISSEPMLTGPMNSESIKRRVARCTHRCKGTNGSVHHHPTPQCLHHHKEDFYLPIRHAGGFLSSSFPGSFWPKDVMISYNPNRDAMVAIIAKYKRSEKSFSHPYSESGSAGQS